MNIKISKDEAALLNTKILSTYLFGSRLYGNHNEDSDYDQLHVCDYIDKEHELMENVLSVNHQFQHDDKEANTQNIYTTRKQFLRNIFSGDSTINVDIIMWTPSLSDLNIASKDLYGYNIIKAYLGFAKRDIRNYKKKNKAGHVYRGIKTAQSLLRKELPELKKCIGEYYSVQKAVSELNKSLEHLRVLHDTEGIYKYPLKSLEEFSSPLVQKLANSMNVREFKYDH